MADLQIQISQTGGMDWVFDGFGGVAYATDDIQTAVLLSIYTNKGSWFGDTYSKYVLGSDLYLLTNSTITSQAVLLLQAKDYVLEALQWLLTENLVQSFAVQTAMLTTTMLAIYVQVLENTPQAKPINYTFSVPL